MQIRPFRGTNADIEQIAGRFRCKVDGSGLSSASVLRRLVERTGGEIVMVEDPSDQEIEGGSLVIRGQRDYTIFLSPYTTPLRDNFTIAHELGHYVLHFFPVRDSVDTPLSFTRYGTTRLEWQANRFAAALLMPAPLFVAAYESSNGDLELLSGQFDVSLPAVKVRAKSLGLADA